MNILITGASRGIGAAAYALLKKTGHNVVGHSTRGSDTLIPGDITDPAAPMPRLAPVMRMFMPPLCHCEPSEAIQTGLPRRAACPRAGVARPEGSSQ
jgi:NAD(P)-dependent dehydrogenase (short-subunit alcohol dehydrogenase family)